MSGPTMLYQAGKDTSGVRASEDIPKAMDAVVALGKEGGDKKGKPLGYKFQRDYKTPTLDEGEVLLGVEWSGICHTDILCLDGILVVDKPRIPGHEFAGKIVAVGPGVADEYLGKNKLVLALYGGKGRQPNLDRHAVFTGVAVDGGFAQYFKVGAGDLVSIPEGVTTKHAFSAGDALMTSMHAVSKVMRKYDAGENARVVVYGATGGLGVATVLNLIADGVSPQDIYAIDVRQEYLEKMKEVLGVNIINSEGKPVAETIRLMNGGKRKEKRGREVVVGGEVDAVIDCYGSGGNIKKAYAGIEELAQAGIGDGGGQLNMKSFKAFLEQQFSQTGTINDALQVVRKGGDIQVIGSRGDHILYPTGKFMENERDWSGPWGGTPADAKAVLEDIRDGIITKDGLELLLGKEIAFTAEGFDQGVEALRKSEVMGRIYFKVG